MEPIWIALVIAVQTIMLAGLAAWAGARKEARDTKTRAEEKQQDYDRQDLVAARIEVAARQAKEDADRVVAKVDAVASATEIQTPKIEEALSGIKGVEKMVDGAASRASAEADGLRQEIRLLREQAAVNKEQSALRQQGALIAQAVASVDRTTTEIKAGVDHLNGMDEPSDGMEQNIADTAKHTGETAKNTARVQATVDDVKSQVEELKDKKP